MALNNAIGPYYETTQEFVDELQNHLKVAKVCDNEHFEDCFGYDKLLLANGEEFDLADITSGDNLGKNTSDDVEYLETVGLVTVNGTGMILSWNKKCPILEPKVYKWGNNTNETTSCIAALIDVSLDKAPNRINKDIALFNAESPSKNDCGMQFSQGGQDYCWGTPFTPTPLTDADCTANKTTYGITNCTDSNYSNEDYWGGAMKQCKDEGKRLPNQGELKALAQYLYDTQNINDSEKTFDLTLNTTKLANLSNVLSTSYTPRNYLYLWSGVEFSKLESYTRRFYPTYTHYYSHNRYTSAPFGVCVP